MSILKLGFLTPTTAFLLVSTPVLTVQQPKDPPAAPIPAQIRTAQKKYMRRFLFALAVLILCGSAISGQGVPSGSKPYLEPSVPSGSKLYIKPMNGVGTYLAKAILARKVPITVVLDEAQADYIVNGSWGRELPVVIESLDTHPLSFKYNLKVSVVNCKTALTAFSYSSSERATYDPSKEMAADWANHLRSVMLKDKNEKQR